MSFVPDYEEWASFIFSHSRDSLAFLMDRPDSNDEESVNVILAGAIAGALGAIMLEFEAPPLAVIEGKVLAVVREVLNQIAKNEFLE